MGTCSIPGNSTTSHNLSAVVSRTVVVSRIPETMAVAGALLRGLRERGTLVTSVFLATLFPFFKNWPSRANPQL